MVFPKLAIGIQARLSSSRFPSKIIRPLWDGKTVLDSCIHQAIVLCELLKAYKVHTTIGLLIPESQAHMIQKHLMNPRPYNLVVVPGDESDVFSRYETFYRKTNCHYMMRITADCPVWNPFLATQLFLNMMEHHADYAHISTPDDFPDGLDVEIIREDLMQALINYPKKHEGIKEHVTISFKGSEGPKASCIYRLPQIMEFSSYPKLSIDTPEDLERVLQTKDKLWWVNKNGF